MRRLLEQAIQQAIDGDSMLYNRKTNCPDDERDRELKWIYHLAEIAPDGPAVECGVGNGGTLKCWSVAREGRGQIIAVDIKPQQPIEGVIQYKMRSDRVPPHIVGQVAFCFIDADHSEGGIRADLTVWPDKIMPNGILAIHDYGSPHEPAIKKVVDEWQAKVRWELVGQVGSLVAFRKNVTA